MKRQQGLGLISWIMVIAIASVFITLIIRIVPVYMDYFSVKDILTDLQTDSGSRVMPKREIRLQLHKRFRTNSLWDLKADEVVKIIKDKDRGLVFHLKYEIREPIVGNIDFIISFDEMIEPKV